MSASPSASPLPSWALALIELYQSHASSQFILFGNVHDKFLNTSAQAPRVCGLADFLVDALMARFDIVLTYDIGAGLHVVRGGDVFGQWPAFRDKQEIPKAPRAAVEFLTRFFRFASNAAQLGGPVRQVGCLVGDAHLVAPAGQGHFSAELGAVALLMREWSEDEALTRSPLATFLLCENLNDLHPMLAANPRAATVKVPIPDSPTLAAGLRHMAVRFPVALEGKEGNALQPMADRLTGTTLHAVEHLLKLKEYRKEPVRPQDLVSIKKDLIERECNQLIEFVESRRTLNDLAGQEPIKQWLRQDLALWHSGHLEAMPMGYLICGPVGTGKTFMVECLAGEAGIPVVKLKNFRDKWVGSTEGNLERIFRQLHALGQCFVFVDEADQTLGKRDAGTNDSGLSGRVYSMFAQEMSRTANRGRLIWVLASSRPDLIEVDLKRPGRIDAKIPLFPTATPEEGFALIQALCRRREMTLPDGLLSEIRETVPDWLTPGAAESLAVKVFRFHKVEAMEPAAALRRCLVDYQPPVPRSVLEAQVRLAVRESTDASFVPEAFRSFANEPSSL